MAVAIRDATQDDALAIAGIYNQGIEERGATVETDLRSADGISTKVADSARFPLLGVEDGESVLGWASLT